MIFKKEPATEFAGVRVTHWTTELPIEVNKVCVGIDPGSNLGITYISDLEVSVYNGQMPPGTSVEHGVRAYELSKEFCEFNCLTSGDVSVVEGASFGSQYGQVGLAEIRFGFYLGLLHSGLTVSIVPPTSIRKVVFNNGKLKADEVWPCLNPNAAAGLSMGIYALLK
jgi:hypothetical protein